MFRELLGCLDEGVLCEPMLDLIKVGAWAV